eukprot:scaffold1100_cov220-Skeletonema_marinoi.AAC.1
MFMYTGATCDEVEVGYEYEWDLNVVVVDRNSSGKWRGAHRGPGTFPLCAFQRGAAHPSTYRPPM